MVKERVVIDASVMVQWFLEPGSEAAFKLKEDHLKGEYELVVPESAMLEVLNSLQEKGVAPDALVHAAKTLREIKLIVEPVTDELLESAAGVAAKHKLTLFGALCVALSEREDIPYFTANTALREIPRVALLGKVEGEL